MCCKKRYCYSRQYCTVTINITTTNNKTNGKWYRAITLLVLRPWWWSCTIYLDNDCVCRAPVAAPWWETDRRLEDSKIIKCQCLDVINNILVSRPVEVCLARPGQGGWGAMGLCPVTFSTMCGREMFLAIFPWFSRLWSTHHDALIGWYLPHPLCDSLW